MILDGKNYSIKIKENLKNSVNNLVGKYKVRPKMAIILVGNSPPSELYVKNKLRSAQEVGIDALLIRKEDTISKQELIELIRQLNHRDDIHGFIVQLPLPRHLDETEIMNLILPTKDIDGMGLINRGKLFSGMPCLNPATPYGIMQLLDYYQINLVGKEAVVIGRSNIVGKPMALMLLKRDATVTIAHSKTHNLKQVTKRADIVVVAVGQPKLITAEMIKPGAVVIDVGMNRLDGKLCGDVDFEDVFQTASHITPVPGGVGPLTITSLLQNTLIAYEKQMEKDTI